MQYEVFAVPVLGGEEAMDRLNRFLRGHKVVQVDKELVKMVVKLKVRVDEKRKVNIMV